MTYNAVSLENSAVGCQVGGLAKASADLVGPVVGGRKCRWGHADRCYLKGRCGRCRLFNPSLDRHLSSSDVEAGVHREAGVEVGHVSGQVVGGWSRKQKRGYNRVLSCLQLWQSNGYQMLWVMLSSGPASDPLKLAEHHDRLIKMVERRGFPWIHHFQVRTSEGHGVLHVVWAWKAEDGFRSKSFFVNQSWLSQAWDRLHGARVVWICRIGARRRDAFKVARYCIAQYVGEQSGYEYMSYSWKRSFGFPLVSCWRKFKELTRSFDDLVREWSRFLAGEVVWSDYGGFTMGSIRLGYQAYGSEFWDMLHWK